MKRYGRIARRRKRIRRTLTVLTLVLVLSIAAASYYIYKDFSIKGIEVRNNTTYLDSEVIEAIKNEDYVPNSLIMTVLNKIFDQTYLPFVEKVAMSCEDHHILHVKVKEKLRAGVFKYEKKYVYFNEQGVALESRNTLFHNVPRVTGVEFEAIRMNEKIKVPGDYFDTIVEITTRIAARRLEISEIHFDGPNDITLKSGKFKIYLGSKDFLDEKISRIQATIESVSEDHKKGIIDMSHYNDDTKIITYRKK